MKILVTGGGTSEKVDEMRTLSNRSTGQTSIKLAEALAVDHEVTLMLARDVKYTNNNLTIVHFDDSESMLLNFKLLGFSNFNIIIQAAAVSDYQVLKVKIKDEEISFSKIPSGLDNLSIEFKKAPKIINKIKTIYPNTFLVGFKLTSNLKPSEYTQSIKRVFTDSNADLIVHNDLDVRRSGLDNFNLYHPDLEFSEVKSIPNLAKSIVNYYQNIFLKGDNHDFMS